MSSKQGTFGMMRAFALAGAVAWGLWSGVAVQAQETQPERAQNSEYTPSNGGGYVPSTYPEAFADNVFYPGQELRALPPSRAQAVAARAEVRRLDQALNNSIEDVRRHFTRSSELREAMAEERDAYQALQVARDDAMNDLKNDQNYLALQRLRQRLADQIDLSKRDARTSTEELLALATVKLTYAATASAMEAAAVSAEPRVKDARRRLVEAGNRVSSLRERFDEDVRSDPTVTAARNALAAARVNAQASEALYVEALNVANVSMDFAYYLRQHPYPYVINSPYYPYYGSAYGYGSGYGYGGYGFQVGYPIGYPYNWGTTHTPARPKRR